MKRFVIIVAAALVLAIATPGSATSFSTDQSDLWWNPNESGWGVQLVQRGAVIFATMFVYDAAGKPTWYAATLNATATSNWVGDLYTTTGPWFGAGPFDPASVSTRKVGTMSWFGQFLEAGVLTYSVDGVAVTKNIQRQLLVYDNYNGVYNTGLSGSTTGCSNPLNNGAIDGFASTTVTQVAQDVRVYIVAEAGTITITGTLSQNGQFGQVLGTYIQSDGEAGNAKLSEMNVQMNSLTGRLSLDSTNRGCQSVVHFGGSRAL